jgi:SAM-dependent methyltransferase
MSTTTHRDRWISSKKITSALFSRLRGEQWTSQLRDDISAIRSIWRDVTFADNFSDFYAAIDRLTEISRRIASASHEAKFLCDWRVAPPPEFNDQFVNHYYLMPTLKRTFWLEGVIFCGLGIEPGQRLLELCCGSGYYADHFYSPLASEVVAVDFDPRAIEMAQRFHQRPNIRYEVMDIRETFPEGPFETVIWDGAIEHFTIEEIDGIMERMRKAMTGGARLLGYTVAEPVDAPQLPTHETHFQGVSHLGDLLKRYFKNVRVFERLHPSITPLRHNLFFYASDGVLPFDPEWEHGLRL